VRAVGARDAGESGAAAPVEKRWLAANESSAANGPAGVRPRACRRADTADPARLTRETPDAHVALVMSTEPKHAGRPDLSVIVVTHNRAELALTTLRTAHAAVRALAVEWIVVDSGSCDDTPAAIEAQFPHVRVLREPNIGFAAANNVALERVRGRYVLLLNPDVEIVEGTFDELLATLDTRTEIGVASVVQNAPDGSLLYSVRRFPSTWLALGEALGASRWTPLGGWREEEHRRRRYDREAAADWLVGAFLLARAEALRDVGPLDECFFLYSEETDWCYRFRRAGWTVAHLPLMTVTHHTGGGEPRADLAAQLSYAKILFARKHYGRIRAAGIRAALVLRHALRVGGLARSWRSARAAAERRALGVVLGVLKPPFQRSTRAGRRQLATSGPGGG
jgi:GT2 family glycosyltransferase